MNTVEDQSHAIEVNLDVHSPVQEHHLDFLLEEEFACNPEFLDFFLKAAKEHFDLSSIEDTSLEFMNPHPRWTCRAVRSVTTDEGETDVLVIYSSAELSRRVAILVENKIRATFQSTQAERYNLRGEAGCANGQWDVYWSCLVSPSNYAGGNEGFDTRVSLEKLSAFFAGDGLRTRFKLGVIERAIKAFSRTGLQKKDEVMTRFRAVYSSNAAAFFTGSNIVYPKPRDAWYGDNWFNFRSPVLPSKAEIVYKSRAGFVDLSFVNTDKANLQLLLDANPGHSGIEAVQTGKSASLRMRLDPIAEFQDAAKSMATIDESYRCVMTLVNYFTQSTSTNL